MQIQRKELEKLYKIADHGVNNLSVPIELSFLYPAAGDLVSLRERLKKLLDKSHVKN